MNTSVSLTTEQVDTIDTSLERALGIASLLVDCGPVEKHDGDLPSPGSLTAVFQMIVEELGKIVVVMDKARG